MASINMRIRTDSELKAQAEFVLPQLGMIMKGHVGRNGDAVLADMDQILERTGRDRSHEVLPSDCVASRIDEMLLRHMEFLARASSPAAKQFRKEFASRLEEGKQNPCQFPWETDLNLPEHTYRKALFFRRYKALFIVEKSNVYLDAAMDCRQDSAGFQQ